MQNQNVIDPYISRRLCPYIDDCVGNEALDTLFWLKWGFVVLFHQAIYSRKYKKNAKLDGLIYFEFW